MSDRTDTTPGGRPARITPLRRALLTLACGGAAFAVLLAGYASALDADARADAPARPEPTHQER